MTYVIGYLRYSSKKQKEGSSEARQKDEFARFCASNSEYVAWPDEYCDRGKSGYKGHHLKGDFGRLLADIKAKKFPPDSIIYFEDESRFGRQKYHTSIRIWHEDILDHGYRIGARQTVYSKQTPDMEMITVIIAMILAHEHSENLSRKLIAANQQKRDRGNKTNKTKQKTKCCPKWLKVTEDGKGYALNEKAVLMRRAIDMAIGGHGCGAIAQKLGLNFGLRNSLRCASLLGYYQPKLRRDGKKTNIGEEQLVYPPICDLATFHKLQAALDSRKTSKGRKGLKVTNLFTHLLFDAADGAEMWARVDPRGIVKIFSRRAMEGVKGCKTFRYPLLEKGILTYLGELKASELRPHDTSDDEISILEGQIAELTSKKEMTLAYFVKKGDKTQLAILERLDNELGTLTASLETLQRSSALPDASTRLKEAQSVQKAMADASGEELYNLRTKLKSMIAGLISEIWVKVYDTQTCDLQIFFKSGEIRCLHIDRTGDYQNRTLKKGQGVSKIGASWVNEEGKMYYVDWTDGKMVSDDFREKHKAKRA